MPVGLNSASRAAGTPAIGDARLASEITDFFLPGDARLDERTRLAIANALAALVGAVEADIRRHAARLLAGSGHNDAADAVIAADGDAAARLTATGLLRDADLMEEVIARVRVSLIAEALPVTVDADEQPSLLLRLADLPDGVVAAAARALLAVDSRRPGASDLSADLHHRLVWWVAAAARGTDRNPAVDRALADAARRCLHAHDEGERPEVLATRLAAAVDALPHEVSPLLIDALGDRRLTLFIAVLARALGVDGEVIRALVLDPAGDGLWSALRAVGMTRSDIARVALSLADADPRRDIEAFADRLDSIAGIVPEAALAAIAPLTLPRDFRLAIAALEAHR